ncbi:uncharacterized protein LOC121243129 [Juglans microcarpa x Juglans regia]|uniref:uncharacterized protein LOC121243129 n=1 Tax=Juglans microcarpa x Juglans regia TaxID=2249226 RepID=UPI001B7E8737|nr:uncharacterized protein LOC121243129 [Juglans microcarpa x Juglans regia]
MEQEDVQYLGSLGVCREAFKIIYSWKKIFSQISLALVLPLSFIFLAQMEVSELLISEEITLSLCLFKVAYLIFSLIFYLLSTSAVVYTVACIYTTGREVSFKKVMSVVPKVWKRLMLTFLCTFLSYFAYNIVAALILFVSSIFLILINTKFYVLLVFYVAGFVYLSIVWQLANVVTVLEDTCGFHALRKSRALLKGKMWVATFIFVLLGLCHFAIQISFQMLFVSSGSLMGVASRFTYGIICLVLLFMLLLFGLVLLTVIYFVCKSYHQENIDKSALSDHLASYYNGGYVPLKAKDRCSA